MTAHNLTKQYRGKTVLDCSFEFPVGKVIALVGPNGAGKSTLLNIATGLVAQSKGELTLFDQVKPGSKTALDQIAFVSQDISLYRSLSVKSTLDLTDALNNRFDFALAGQRLDELEIPTNKKVSSLSGGQRAQLALTLALARRPKALFLDEPTAALDPLARHEFLGALMTAVIGTDLSVVFSSHSIEELSQVSDHVALLTRGQMQINDSIDDILESHALIQTSVQELKNIPSLEIIEPDLSAEFGHHLIKLHDSSVVNQFQFTQPTLNRIILGYLRSYRNAKPSLKAVS